jgi:WD40 repeat protein
MSIGLFFVRTAVVSQCMIVTSARALAAEGARHSDAMVRLQTKLTLVATLKGCGGTEAVYARNGTRILAADENSARVWDTATFQPITRVLTHDGPRNRPLRHAYIDTGGNHAATIRGRTVRVWRIDGGTLLFHLEQAGEVHTAAFSPDGTILAIGCEDGKVHLWDILKGHRKLTFDHSASVRHAEWNAHDGNLLVGTCNARSGVGTVQVWNVQTQRRLWRYTLQDNVALYDDPAYSPVALSIDGRHIAAVAGDQVVVRDAKTGRSEVVVDGLPLQCASAPIRRS